MARLDEIEKVFKDLRNRVSGLPFLTNKARHEELSDLMIIIGNIERAFISHIAADEDEEGIEGLIGRLIESFPIIENPEGHAKTIQHHLKSKYSVEISTKALKKRIQNHLNNER